jgi:diadenosine tetraphosphatase ApaH/serine/threonine PP2A family protein phosphatase
LRLLLLSDIHGNIEALDACIAAAPAHDLVMNLGDLVGYGASPNEVVDRSRELGHTFVRGNHDRAVSGLTDLKDFNQIAAIAALWTREQLSAEKIEWLRSLPHGPIQIEGLDDVQFVHGSPLDEDEYVVSVKEAFTSVRASSVSLTFFGHTHLQGVFAINHSGGEDIYPSYKTVGQSETYDFPLEPGSRYMVNPGSVGQPRDGDWRAAFALFDSDSRIITFSRVPYALKSSQDRILAANLPPRLATRLAAGR